MLPNFVIPESVIREAGTSAEIGLGPTDSLVLLTLGITRIIEQESLDVSIWGSPDGNDWGSKPIVAFPQKFYCGTYQLLVDITKHPNVKYLRVKWSAQRWGKGDSKPLFALYVFAQEMKSQAFAVTA